MLMRNAFLRSNLDNFDNVFKYTECILSICSLFLWKKLYTHRLIVRNSKNLINIAIYDE